MNVINDMKRDHAMMRTELNDLEAALSSMDFPRAVNYRSDYRIFLRQYEGHIRRKGQLITSCRGALANLVPEELSHAEQGERYEQQLFRRIGRLLSHTPEQSPGPLHCRAFTRAAVKLRQHMEEEESALFPAIHYVLTKRKTMDRRQAGTGRSW